MEANYKIKLLGIDKIMKSFGLFSILLLALALPLGKASILSENGQPSCDLEELNIGIHRNIWDPTRYWECSELNEPAETKFCPDQTAFMNSVKKCVEWKDWRWEDSTMDTNINGETN